MHRVNRVIYTQTNPSNKQTKKQARDGADGGGGLHNEDQEWAENSSYL